MKALVTLDASQEKSSDGRFSRMWMKVVPVLSCIAEGQWYVSHFIRRAPLSRFCFSARTLEGADDRLAVQVYDG